jgi:hypothetical protein
MAEAMADGEQVTSDVPDPFVTETDEPIYAARK